MGLLTMGASLTPLALAGAAPSGVDFSQCANGAPFAAACSWTNGNLNLQNSTYYEGDATTQVVALTGLAAGQYTLSFQYSTIFKTKNSYDFLTNYNESNTFLASPKDVCTMAGKAEDVTACQDSAVSVTSTPIVQDPSIAATVGGLSAYTSANYQMIGGFLVSATAPTAITSSNGTNAQVAVTFVVGGTGAQATTGITSGKGGGAAYTAYLTFGAHVANEAQWGSGTGAASITGSPYHVILVSLLDAQGNAAAGVGGQDNQMQGALENNPSITLAKSASPTIYSAAGQSITYTYVITNNGSASLPLTQYVVTDDHITSPFNCGSPSALAVGATVTCTALYTTTSADVTSGSVTNTATASGGQLTTSPATATVTYSTTGISLAKSASPTVYSAAGQTITYTYTITNVGSVSLASTQYTITDDHIPTSPFNCGGKTSLAPGGTVSCTKTYSTTSADVSAKSVTNTATASGGGLTSAPVSASVYLAAIGLTKSASSPTYSSAGQTITYTYTITNSGAAPLASTQYSVSDDKLGTFNCASPTALAVGASVSCTKDYTITSGDVTAGSVTNTATASGGGLSSPQASQTVTYSRVAISLAKSVSPSTYSAAGQPITYTYVITNSGVEALASTQYSVSDNKINGGTAFNCGSPTALAVGATVTCTALYTTTSADVTAGSVTNTATASGGELSTGPASATANFVGITLAKTAAPSTYFAAGDVITYTYVITNSGHAALASTQYSVSDNKINAGTAFSCGSPTALAVGASVSCTNTYTITSADVTAHSLTNTASASGGGLTSAPASSTVNLIGIALTKSASPSTYTSAGQTITYTYTITNVGATPLTSTQYSVSDDKLGVFSCGSPTALAAGASVSCTKAYTITSADLSAGKVTNTATASGGELSTPPVSATVTVWTSPPSVSSIALAKSASPSTYSAAGQTITYTYVITNVGTVAVGPAQFTVSDNKLGAINCGAATVTLNPGATVSCTATYTTTAADVTAGKVTNTATASGGGLTSPPVSATVSLTSSPAIGLTKSASPNTYTNVGDVITYTYTITNTGNVALAPATYSVSDDKVGTISLVAPTGLAVGQSITLTGTYTITAADLAAGSVTNTATASGGGLTSSPVSATVNWAGEVTTSIHVNPVTSIPSNGPATGAGGAAHSDGGVIMGVSALALLAGLALASVLLRRRRA